MATYGVVVVGLMVMLSHVSLGSAKVYTVGDTSGWALSVDYATWASDKIFKVGDSLVFNYDSSHTVDLVSKGDYTTCTIGNSVASYNSGTTGSHYFICGVMGHCSGGMKLNVDVTSPSSAPTPFTLTPPPPPPTLTPVESSSAAISPLLGVGAIFCLLAFIYL